MTGFPRLFEPCLVGAVELPNRIVRSAAATNFGGVHLTEELIDFEESHARGGVGLIILGDASVHPTCPAPLVTYEDAIIGGYRRLADRIRPYGTKLFQQLWYSGSPYPNACGGPPWSSSPVPAPLSGLVPSEMSEDQIAELVQHFADGARRCEEGGLDGVEIHAGHGYIFQQFLSPLTNQRSDRYGGSAENRQRFTLEVARAVRGAVSRQFAVGIRISSQGFEGGLCAEDLIPLVQSLTRDGAVDFVNVSQGSYSRLNKVLGSMYEKPGYQLEPNEPLLRSVKVPRIVNGRFTTLAQADAVLADGLAELVGITRGMIADPDLVAKSRAGRAASVRPCIACNDGCIGDMAAGPITCWVNPAVGRERSVATAMRTKVAQRRVLVVGGGPAGMEAARGAAQRGHAVTLIEAAQELGGQLRFARMAPHYELLGEFADWQTRTVRELGVDVRLGRECDLAMVRELGPDVLILATGSRPRCDGVQYPLPRTPPAVPADLPWLSSWTVLSGGGPGHGDRVLVLDETGHHEAVATLSSLLARGCEVTVVTAQDQFAPLLARSVLTTPVLEFLARHAVRIIHRTLVRSVRHGGVVLQEMDSGRCLDQAVDAIVAITPNRAHAPLGELPRRPGLDVHVVGDCLSPRLLGAAVREGFLAGLAAGEPQGGTA